ncbi:MAG: IS3 family transposase [Candidatus Electryonea clarkiae]|nr:IS3 family transposase [Candidatus Electryonea clarkiae]MDP8286917.1 IS3 family transposase [Candidatus Electryonea clarkiae]
MMSTTQEISVSIGVSNACKAVGVARSSYYYFYRRYGRNGNTANTRPSPSWSLTSKERQQVLDALHDDSFVDKAPHQVYATLLDQGIYFCSIRTMYRILHDNNEVCERRRQHRHTHYSKPELLATSPNQVWSWDITKLKGPRKWTYFYLYVILDIYSRYVTGWMLAYRESSALAKRLIKQTCVKQNIEKEQLTIHADRGPSMKSKPVALLLSELGVTKSHSRPYVSNDNPYSEAQFKTMKYTPQFPGRFDNIDEAIAFCRDFFEWYNKEHRHTGIALLTPEMVHYGLAESVIEKRNEVLKKAFEKHPERFKGKLPKAEILPQNVWINKPEKVVIET